MIRIELPWPPRELHPNARPHFMGEEGDQEGPGRCGDNDAAAGVRRATPTSRRSRHGHLLSAQTSEAMSIICSAAIKSGLDGIADVIGVDDSKWQIALRKDEPVKGGAVRIELEAA
jgi:crossover junction endodeoxyribonuclease RusA